MSSTGAKTYHKLQSGKFTSVVCHNHRVYTANYHASQVWVFAINNDAGFKLVIVGQLVIPEGWTTLSVRNTFILCCNRDEGEVYILPFSYSGSGVSLIIAPVAAPPGAATRGEPYICDDDVDTTVMICDRRHSRFVLLNNSIQFSRPLIVDAVASCVAALKDRKTNFLFVVRSSPNVLTIHHGLLNPVDATSHAGNDLDDATSHAGNDLR